MNIRNVCNYLYVHMFNAHFNYLHVHTFKAHLFLFSLNSHNWPVARRRKGAPAIILETFRNRQKIQTVAEAELQKEVQRRLQV